jgi:glycosyltransferase involved in cell wall biosynthesis
MQKHEENNGLNNGSHAEGERRVRVLVVAPSLDINGGQSRMAARMVALLGAEPTLEVGFLPHNPRLPGALRLLQRIKYVRTLVTTAFYIGLLLVRVPRYDVIHVFSASYYSYLLSAASALFVARLYGRKSVLNYRSGQAENHLANWPRTAAPTMRWADVIVAPSGYLVDVFARHGLPARYVYNMVDLERFRYRERQPVRPVFLTGRLLEPLYNVPCALRAFQLVQRRYPEARLTVAGDGSLRAELERLAFDELHLRNTEFVGFVPHDRMPELHAGADIYLNAPNIDNMPSSLTECMASGLVIVTTDAGGIPYIVTHEETCLMVERGDQEAMAAAACRLLEEDGLAATLTRRAREEGRKFTWPAVRDEWLKLYGELAHEELTHEDPARGRAFVKSAADAPRAERAGMTEGVGSREAEGSLR